MYQNLQRHAASVFFLVNMEEMTMTHWPFFANTNIITKKLETS